MFVANKQPPGTAPDGVAHRIAARLIQPILLEGVHFLSVNVVVTLAT